MTPEENECFYQGLIGGYQMALEDMAKILKGGDINSEDLIKEMYLRYKVLSDREILFLFGDN